MSPRGVRASEGSSQTGQGGEGGGGGLPAECAQDSECTVAERTPQQLPDDDRAYELAADCAALPIWPLDQHLEVSPAAWQLADERVREDQQVQREPVQIHCAMAGQSPYETDLAGVVPVRSSTARLSIPSMNAFVVSSAGK